MLSKLPFGGCFEVAFEEAGLHNVIFDISLS